MPRRGLLPPRALAPPSPSKPTLRALRVVSGPPPDTNLPVATVRFDRFCRDCSGSARRSSPHPTPMESETSRPPRWVNPRSRGTVDPVPPPQDGAQQFCHQIKKDGWGEGARGSSAGIKKAAGTRFQRSAAFRGASCEVPCPSPGSTVARAATPAVRSPRTTARAPRSLSMLEARGSRPMWAKRLRQSAVGRGGTQKPALLTHPSACPGLRARSCYTPKPPGAEPLGVSILRRSAPGPLSSTQCVPARRSALIWKELGGCGESSAHTALGCRQPVQPWGVVSPREASRSLGDSAPAFSVGRSCPSARYLGCRFDGDPASRLESR